VYYITVGANKATEGKEISNVAMENATMASEASANDGTGKGAPASKDSGERLCRAVCLVVDMCSFTSGGSAVAKGNIATAHPALPSTAETGSTPMEH